MVENAKREKGPFEYLFLDIEWNQAPGTSGLDGREAIQIGVVAADAQIQKVKTFSKAIRLSDPKVFNEETEIISHSTIAHVMRGNEEKAVLEKFAQSFPQYCHLIVWRRDAYELFLRDMRKCGITIKRHRVVVLQDVLGVINSIQKAKNKKNREDLKQLPPTETNIEKICKWFKLSYSVSSNAVFVRTAFSRWIVYLREDKVKELFHENYRANKSQYFNKQKMKCTEGYHKQKLPSESFFEVIQYIKYHDAGTVKRMVKKSRLEKLLEMVEMELKMKNMEEKDYGYDNMPELRRTNIG